jgi:hypothetical protein
MAFAFPSLLFWIGVEVLVCHVAANENSSPNCGDPPK